MTVQDLIDYLSTLPLDFPIVYRFCSDYEVMDVDDINVQTEGGELCYGTVIEHHNMPGRYRKYSDEKMTPAPKPANVVVFPGN